MLHTINEIEQIASRYGIPNEDLFIMAVNLGGVQSDIDFGRIRFALTLEGQKQFALAERYGIRNFYIAVPNRADSKFSICNDQIVFDNQTWASVVGVTEDICDTNYPRRNGTVMNINPNTRTSCRGCRFCYTGYQVPNDNEPILTESALRCFFTKWMTEQNRTSLAHLEQIAVVTGCFRDEEEVVSFLLLLRRVTATLDFKGEIFYLGSQISSAEAIAALQDAQPFAYCISLECFENREHLVRDKKRSMGVGNVQRILNLCEKHGHTATFSYILGLDSFEAIKVGFSLLAKCVNRFPIINLLQIHKQQQNIRHTDASEFGYYLETRLFLEQAFHGTNLLPRSWENYRGLWYLRYKDIVLSDARMPWPKLQ